MDGGSDGCSSDLVSRQLGRQLPAVRWRPEGEGHHLDADGSEILGRADEGDGNVDRPVAVATQLSGRRRVIGLRPRVRSDDSRRGAAGRPRGSPSAYKQNR